MTKNSKLTLSVEGLLCLTIIIFFLLHHNRMTFFPVHKFTEPPPRLRKGGGAILTHQKDLAFHKEDGNAIPTVT